MPVSLSSGQFADLIRFSREVYAPGCAAHSPVFEGWLRESPDCAAHTTFSGVHIPTVNRFDFAGLSPTTRFRGIFLSSERRAAYEQGRMLLLPLSYLDTWHWLKSEASFDLALLQISPPDTLGNCSLGVACDFTPAAWPRSRRVIAHVNPNMPRTNGPSVPWSKVDAAIEVAAPLLEIPDAKADATLGVIAKRIAALVPDGCTIQLGLGKLQAEVLRALAGHRGLRIHAGMVSDGLLALADSGALATENAVTCGVAIGTDALYARVPDIARFAPVGETHDLSNLASIRGFTAINSALEVDLFGQVNGELGGGRQISGAGGLADFARGARLAPGGRSIIAMTAADADGASRILPRLPPGPVSLSRLDADIVVTEHGAASIRTLDIDARAQALISIAAPAHRESLERAWYDLRRAM
jgi:acyl-CoA hydrolase